MKLYYRENGTLKCKEVTCYYECINKAAIGVCDD